MGLKKDMPCRGLIADLGLYNKGLYQGGGEVGLKEGTKCLQTKQDINKYIKMGLNRGVEGRGEGHNWNGTLVAGRWVDL